MKSQILKSPLPYIALFFAHIIWGANFVFAKLTLEEFPPMTLAFLRFGLAFILLAPFLFKFERKQLAIKVKHWLQLILAGIFMVTLNIALFFEGLSRTSAINASALSMSIPIISILIAWIFLKEKIYWINFLGIIFGLLGAFVIIGVPLLFVGKFSSVELLGNFLILLSSLTGVVGVLFAKELLKTYHPLIISEIVFGVGMVTFAIPAVMEYYSHPLWVQKISIFGLLGLLYMAVLASIVAYFLLNWSLEKIDVVKAKLFEYMNPAVTATLAVPLLGERISFSFIIGTCLVVLGVYWGTLGKEAHHHLQHKHHRI